MPKTKLLFVLVVAFVLCTVFFLGYRRWSPHDSMANRAELLSLLPADTSAVGFLDLQQLRNSPLLAQLMPWAPQPPPDSDYAQFIQSTGFDYERDLDHLAVALNRQSGTDSIFAVAEGRFDRKKIDAYAARFGSLKTADGRTLFAVPINGSERKAYFTFFRADRIAWANDSSYFFQHPAQGNPQDWRDRFSRVAGTPLFVVLRQEALPAEALARAPGGFRSPQLAALLSQLQWITISGKPEGNVLRVVIDGESVTEATAHQLKEFLSGLVVLAQMGLNDVKTRKQLDPDVRQSYLDLLQSADIQQVDRGTSKSVRVILDVTAKLLQAPRKAASAADPPETKH